VARVLEGRPVAAARQTSSYALERPRTLPRQRCSRRTVYAAIYALARCGPKVRPRFARHFRELLEPTVLASKLIFRSSEDARSKPPPPAHLHRAV